jgi:soluble lytic murein transglycosylase-like protein
MLWSRFRGALARARLMVALVSIAFLFGLPPQAYASPATCRLRWPAMMPGDAHRFDREAECRADRPAWSLIDKSARVNSGGAPSRYAVAALVEAKAAAIGVPVSLALAIARFESGLHMLLHGSAGERGAMQVLPQTARQVGIAGNLYGPAGIEAGVRYLKLAIALHRRAGWCAVASAYNVGVWRESRCTAYGRAVVAMASRP